MIRALLALLSLLLVPAFSSSAATVDVILNVDPVGTFELSLRASDGDNFGIAGYVTPLRGGITSLDHSSPWTTFGSSAAGVGFAGFTFLRSPDGTLLMGAFQDTVSPTPNLVRGFGQEASSFEGEGIFTGLQDGSRLHWTVPLRIATGTWSGAMPYIDPNDINLGVNVFRQPTGIAAMAADLQLIRSVVPEPSAFVLCTLLGLICGCQHRRFFSLTA